MPYLLMNLVDGERPGSAYVAAGTTPGPGQVLLEDTDFIGKEYWLWDATAGALRAPTGTDALRIAKRRKEVQVRDAANAALSVSTRATEREVVVYKAASGAALNADDIAIRDAMTANYNALRAKVAQVRAATTVEGVEGMTW